MPTAGELPSSGHVLDMLVAVLYCFFSTETLEDGAIAAANLGDDANSVAEDASQAEASILLAGHDLDIDLCDEPTNRWSTRSRTVKSELGESPKRTQATRHRDILPPSLEKNQKRKKSYSHH